MQSHIKAAVYSGLVFPGAGYFFLKKVKRAVIFVLLTLLSLIVVLYDAIYKAQIIAQKIVNGEIPFDLTIIRQQISATAGVLDASVVVALYSVMAVLWLVSVVDCYRLGKLKDKLS